MNDISIEYFGHIAQPYSTLTGKFSTLFSSKDIFAIEL